MNLWDGAIGVSCLAMKSVCSFLEKQEGEKAYEKKNTYIYLRHYDAVINS